MSWYIKRGRKLWLSISGSRLYVIVACSLRKERRTWCWLLIIAPKSIESAWAAVVLKVGASAGRNPPLLTRRRKLSRRFRSDSFRRPHQAGDAYNILASVVAQVTSCRAWHGIPRDRKVLSANVDEEHELRMLLTWCETDSLSSVSSKN